MLFSHVSKASVDELSAALEKFDQASPLVKRTLIYACGKAVMADGMIIGEEAELLRAIADTIGCPIPPFVRAKNQNEPAKASA